MKLLIITRFKEIIDITPFLFPRAIKVIRLSNILDALISRLT
jgi:hypothetical protein